ncbi:MAG: aminoacyl-tRNA hydrolase [Azospirillaceae bacterium]
MHLFVGLGNPGPRYAYNRHNIGWIALDEIVELFRFQPWRQKFQGLIAEGTLGGEKVLALKPQTFMNESGRSVGEAVRFYKIPVDKVVVFYDELDLAPGKVRVKQGGGAGGHNGIRSIDRHIGPDYWRVRIGIGHPGDKARVHGYVLSDFAKADEAWLDPLIEAVADSAPMLALDAPDKFMSRVALDMSRVGE